MIKVLVSGCILGELVRYHGGHAKAAHAVLDRWQAEGRIVSVCPEVLGGLATPRPPAEIVLGTRTVMTRDGKDVTAEFVRGANVTARTAAQHSVRVAIMKSNSPSCGTSVIYDGTFSGAKVAGDGMATALLREQGIALFTENEIDAADRYIAELEAGTVA